ncbi:MAG: L-lactate permease, partial [Anaerolineae bacterium]|nr:L-lactate permease [Anaerolineae bacterium]
MPSNIVTLPRFLLALLPIVIVLVLMVRFRWGGAKAGPVGWLTALAVSLLFFGAGPDLLAYSQMRALLLILYVLYVIWMALVLYNTVVEAGAITTIGQGIIRLTGDRVLQLLILSWVFSSFLQGIAGYGVPIAVVAPLLIGLGFSPVTSVAAVAIGHAWSVNFGSIAASFNALIAASGLPGETLAPAAAQLLGITCFACGIAAVYTDGGLAALRHGLPAILITSAAMAGTQYLLAVGGLWNVAAFVAGLIGLGAMALVARLPFYRAAPMDNSIVAAPSGASNPRQLSTPLAVTPYVILVAVVSIAELVEPVHQVLNAVRIQMSFPETTTALGWTVKAGKGQAISLFGHAGALLIYSSVAAYLLFRATGHYKPGAAKRILNNTVRSAVQSSIGIATMVGFALMMEQSGMTNTIAVGLSRGLAPVYPFVAPFIGVLGAFMTGSN